MIKNACLWGVLIGHLGVCARGWPYSSVKGANRNTLRHR